MGEIADDMFDGSCCTFCGQYFKHPERDEKNETRGIYVHGSSGLLLVLGDSFR